MRSAWWTRSGMDRSWSPKGSPLVIGVGQGEYFIASDASPFLEYTKQAVYLEEDEMALIRLGESLSIRSIPSDKVVEPYVTQLQMDLESIEKEGYDHFMLKEIYEQPKSIHDTMRGRLLPDQGIIRLGGVSEYKDKFLQADRILIACGTSWHAGLVGEYVFEELSRIPVEVEYASEFRYRNPIITEKDVVIAISQSGETADTLAAIRLAKSKGATIFGICNVVGSSIAQEAHAGAYTCGPRDRSGFHQGFYSTSDGSEHDGVVHRIQQRGDQQLRLSPVTF